MSNFTLKRCREIVCSSLGSLQQGPEIVSYTADTTQTNAIHGFPFQILEFEDSAHNINTVLVYCLCMLSCNLIILCAFLTCFFQTTHFDDIRKRLTIDWHFTL